VQLALSILNEEGEDYNNRDIHDYDIFAMCDIPFDQWPI
jgi:hypothetical protein